MPFFVWFSPWQEKLCLLSPEASPGVFLRAELPGALPDAWIRAQRQGVLPWSPLLAWGWAVGGSQETTAVSLRSRAQPLMMKEAGKLDPFGEANAESTLLP